MDCCTILLEERAILSLSRKFKKNGAGIWALLNKFMPKRTMGTAILVALMLHHTASFTARNDTLYID
jgi:hypothetical protein